MDFLTIKEFFKDTIKYIILIIVVLFVAIYVISLQQVVGSSMEPTLNSGDILILDKFSYHFNDIKRGDIVLAYYNDTKYLIKRVVGLPGEKIKYKDNVLYINDTKYDETYLSDTITDNFSLKDIGYDTIPDDMYFVLGDNRSNSLDSRNEKVGLIKKEDIIGKVRFQVWPLNKIKVVK